jgi:histidinol-phosphate phosphatase family protein
MLKNDLNTGNLGCQVAILAGGMGTRLKVRTGNLPKPMVPILGRPVLEHQIDLCRRHGFTRIALLVHYEYESIRNYFENGQRWGVEIKYSLERDARGTAGALLNALDFMDDIFLVLYGDTYVDVDLRALWQCHSTNSYDATLLLHPNDHPDDSDLVEVDAKSRVLALRSYPHPPEKVYRNLVNAALYVLNRSPLATFIPASTKSDLAKHTFPAMLDAGLHLHGYVTPEYIKDMGTPERLDKVEEDIELGLPERLSARQQRHAVFLDRDGTLNVEVNHLRSPSQLVLIPGAIDAIRMINRSGLLAIGVTNQPVLARGDVTWPELDFIHATLDHLLGVGKAYLDRMYVCPHHPNKGFAGEVLELKIDCDCRKPRTGLIDQAVRDLSIARRHSWMVGDSSSDIRAGSLAGLRTILIRTGNAGLDGKYADEPDYVMPDLHAAVNWILRGHAATSCMMLPVTAASVNARLVLIAGPARAGKSCVARVLAEQLGNAGLVAHVLALDGWLKSVGDRSEGTGVLERYDMPAAIASLAPIIASTKRHWLRWPCYERKSRSTFTGPKISIGPDDVLIVEGVTALMDSKLLAASNVRLFVHVDDKLRLQRLEADYAWRGENRPSTASLISSRDLDELPDVLASASHATHHIYSKE